MSRPFITVDYFSHGWDALDLGCASFELNRQVAEIRRKLIDIDNELDVQQDAMQQWGLGASISGRHHISSLNKEKHRLLSEEYRLCRLENVASRQYRAGCDPDARKIDPISINWQKDSDVIWLYGPLFRQDDKDDDFERRLANIRHPQQRQQDPRVKPALRKDTDTKEAHAKRLLGKAISKRMKRRSFPSGLREATMADLASAGSNNEDEDEDEDKETSTAATSQQYKELRFKPDVLEYIYHAELPLRQEKKRRSRKSGTASSSAACQRAKALLLASRMPPSPPSSPAPPEEETAMNQQRLETEENSSADWSGWGWPFSTPSPPQPSPAAPHQEPTIPGLCANLISLSAEVLTLMGTAAVYKGVSYGLGCPSTQQCLRSSPS